VAELSVEADLDFTMTLPGADRREVTGRLRGSGSHLEVEVSDPTVFASRRDAGLVRGVAEALARRGLALTVTSPAGPVMRLGRVRSSWVQRRLTGSWHLRLAGTGALWSMARARNQAAVLPDSELAPPSTLVPLAPTFLRRPRPPVTTTHDPEGGGSPRLVLAPSDLRPRRLVFPLRPGVTQIGSAEECAIVLPGLQRFHAEVRHDDADEFVVVRLGAPGTTRVNGEPVTARTLRTGSRLDLGAWTLTYYREEYADHGRPYGGRLGGEIGHQRPQPPRPMTTRTWEVP
jgi:hypothetical protein